MRKQIKEKIFTTVVIIIAIIMMASIFMRFRTRMDIELNASTATYLSGNVDALAAAFQTKLADQLVMLESQTRYFADVDLTDYNAMKSTIMATRGMEAFTSIGVASSAGSTMSYQGKSSGNILLLCLSPDAAMYRSHRMSARQRRRRRSQRSAIPWC